MKIYNIIIILLFVTFSQNTHGQSTDQNYIHSRTYTDSLGLTFSDQIQYFDGLGRLEQTVLKEITPSRNDLISYQEYDKYGRETNSWLPVSISNSNGAYVSLPTIVNNSLASYDGDSKAYSKVVYENSPLNRVNEQYGAGQEWHNLGKSINTTYMSNIEDDEILNCVFYRVSEVLADTILSLQHTGSYYSGSLFVTCLQDEDGNVTYEFRDKFDRKLMLTRQILQNDGNEELYDTYYVYDSFGNLMAILPPIASSIFVTQDSSWQSNMDEILKKYAFLYKYDNRGRCKAKKLPGCGWVYYIYDIADRLIFSQDGEQRKKGEWFFTLPDAFDRVCVTGICRNNLDALSTNPLTVAMTIKRDNSTFTYKGYTSPELPLLHPQILTVNYYDDYEFLNKSAIAEFNNSRFGFEPISDFSSNYHPNAKTQLTGSLTAKLDENSTTFLSQVMYYDTRGQMIQTHSDNHLGGMEKEYVFYNFVGQPQRYRHIHSVPNKPMLTESYEYTYDHAGRLLATAHTVNDAYSPTVLSENIYDSLGRLYTTKLANQNNLITTYGYNIRSWIQNISNTYFIENLSYTFGGNILTQEWQQAGKTRKYEFSYDLLSRLTSAEYTGDGNYSTNYTYDEHGNITSLSRWGNTGTSTYGLIDNLAMTYNGNQLIKVEDTGAVPTLSSSADFRKAPDVPPIEYTYDVNGNMKSDLNKGISNIDYNLLNLPSSLSISNSLNTVINSYVYSAAGSKLRVNKGSFTTDYVGNVIYENNVLKRILVEGGYYEGGIYYFYINDHLGNNRIVANQNSGVVQSTQYYPFGMAFADGTNPNVQPYKYGGKELDSDRGLNLYDFWMRSSDPALANRFTRIDPHAENYYSISPYVYCANNPIGFIDPDGMDYWSTKDPEQIERFLKSLRDIPSPSGDTFVSFDFSTWQHATDAEFTQNLTFNDETNTFYSSYGYVDQDGTPTIVGVSIQAKGVSEGVAWIDGPGSRWANKASGRINNVYPEFDIAFGGFTKVGRAFVRSMFSRYSITNTINANKSGFAKGGSTKSERKINSKRAESWRNEEMKLREQLKNATTKKEKDEIKRQIEHAILKQKKSEVHWN